VAVIVVAVTTARAYNNPHKPAAGVAKTAAEAVAGAEAAVAIVDVVFHVCQK
jgi:hypothetical protein